MDALADVPSWLQLIAIIGSVFGGAKLVDRAVTRKTDTAITEKIKAETSKTRAETAVAEVEAVREVLAEVRFENASKETRLGLLEVARDRVLERLALLEERERDQLVRTAVHESWDHMTYQLMLVHHPDHPTPPPLSPPPGTARTMEQDALALVEHFETKDPSA